MKVTGTDVVAICLATVAGLWLILFVRKNFLFEEPPAPPDSPVGTFEFTLLGAWMHEGPPKRGGNGTQQADWSVALVVRPGGTLRYEWESLRETPSPSGSLEGAWHEAHQGDGQSSRRWHVRIPGRPEPSRVIPLLGGPVSDEISWYGESGWWIAGIDPETGALTDSMWLHRRAPRR